jgi:hypothetical protein
MKLNRLYIILFLLLSAKAQAQVTLIDARIEHADILIGEQTVVHLTVTVDNGKFVYWPIPTDTLMTGVEVLAFSKPDTTLIDNNRLVINQDVLITSFDEELYLLPSFLVIDGADSIYSNRIALKVSTIDVNADAPDEFFDIKEVWKPPFVLADYYPLIFGVLLTLFMICVIGYIVQRLRNRKTIVHETKEDPKIPPHEIAIKELNEIKEQKLWQQGRNKEYYTLVTETLRRYIFRRYNINAMEMTSVEILELIRQEYYDTRSVYDTLKQILQLADYVKFAKLHPLPDENSLSLANSYLFVNQTMQVELPKPSENAETAQQENESNINNE